MSEIRVWAHKARFVELICDGKSLPMETSDRGWWSLRAEHLTGEFDYAFRVDGNGPFPDPRSAWQPNGVHNASRRLDHSRFQWTDRGWQAPPLSSAIIYELHVGTFTLEGTFDAITEKLDHLIELGVTHIELMPVNEFSGSHGWGYDGVDLYAPHQAYGEPDALKRLVNTCHSRGLAVLLDVVYNHLGPSGNYLSQFGPYFTKKYSTPWGEAVNFDGPGSDEVRRFFVENAIMWLRDYHFDGLRIDAVHAIVDTSATHFLELLADEVATLSAHLGRHLVLIAESDLNDPRIIRRQEVGGYGIHAQWNDDFHHALHAVLSGENAGYYRDFGELADLAKVMTTGLAYDGSYSVYRQRSHGRPAIGLSGHNFIGYLQNHDQVGNRAIGDRSSHLLSTGQLKIAAALVILSPFTPLLFQGEEWGASTPFLYFTDHEDPELGEAVRKGRRAEFAEFGWDPDDIPDPQSKDTFLRSKLRWDEINQSQHEEILEWHKQLIRLRRRFPSLSNGNLGACRVVFYNISRCLVVKRGEIMITCNLSVSSQEILVGKPDMRAVLMASDSGLNRDSELLLLPPHSVYVFKSYE